MNTWQLQQTLRVMQSGGVIAYPTEAVWGLGCDPYDQAAVLRLLELKRRPVHKGLILVAASKVQIAALLTELTAEQHACLDQTWPGPNTWLLPDPTGLVPNWVKGQHSQVAIRVSAHPLVKSLCEAWGGPIISTSANPSAADPAKTKLKVMTYFGYRVDKIVDGDLGGLNSPSTIRCITDSSIIRL